MFHPVTQNGRPDRRYSIELEHCGYDRPRYVVRFCDEFIGQSQFRSSAAVMAIGHNQARLGATIITESKP